MLIRSINQVNGVYHVATKNKLKIQSRNSVLAELASSYLTGVNLGNKTKHIINNNIDESPKFICDMHKHFFSSLEHFLSTKEFRISKINRISSIKLLSDIKCVILRLNDEGDFIVINQSRQLVCCNIDINEAWEFIDGVGVVAPKKIEQTYSIFDITNDYLNWCRFNQK